MLLAGALRGGWSEAEVCAEEVAATRKPVWHHREEVAARGRTFGSATGDSAPWQSVRRCGMELENGDYKSFSLPA